MGRGCEGCAPPREITDIRFINFRHWPEQWVRTAAPGDLLLLDGKPGECGGILRMRQANVFIVLGPSHIWRGHTIEWPFKSDRIRALRIRGNKLELILR